MSSTLDCTWAGSQDFQHASQRVSDGATMSGEFTVTSRGSGARYKGRVFILGHLAISISRGHACSMKASRQLDFE
jgi:hypothetical protein